MKNYSRLLLAAATLAAASSAHAAAISLSNSTFDTLTDWTQAQAYANSMYIASSVTYGNVLHFKDGRGIGAAGADQSLTQNLSNINNPGLTAATYGSYSLTVDLGWRTNDQGNDAILRFSLVNMSEGNAVLGFTDFTFVKGAQVIDNYSLRNDDLAINIAYDNTAGNLVGDSIGLKITRIDVLDTADSNRSVMWADNLSISAVPEPSEYGLMGAGALAAVAFVRRRRKLAGKAA